MFLKHGEIRLTVGRFTAENITSVGIPNGRNCFPLPSSNIGHEVICEKNITSVLTQNVIYIVICNSQYTSIRI